MFTGTIPEQIRIYTRPTMQVWQTWDDIPEVAIEDKKKVTVTPAFAVDEDKPKTHETAIKWASGPYFDYELKKVKYTEPKEPIKRPNRPMSGIRVVALEERGKGGRAYKVVTPDYLYFDLREDVLLDSLLHTKIENGVLSGEYVFARVGSEMKLIRVGSYLHEKMVEATAISNSKKLTPKDYVVGGIYKNKTSTQMFLGWFNSLQLDPTYKQHYNYYGDKKLISVNVVVAGKKAVFVNIDKGEPLYSTYDINIVKSPSFTEQVGKKDLSEEQALEIVKKSIQGLYSKRDEYIKNFNSKNGEKIDKNHYNQYDWLTKPALYSLTPIGKPLQLDPRFKEWLDTEAPVKERVTY